MKSPEYYREKHVQQDRRKFLDMLGKAGVSTSLLKASTLVGGIMASRHAVAQNTDKKVVFCYLPDGAPSGTWMPSNASQMNVCTQPYGAQGHNVASLCHFRAVDVLTTGHANMRQALGVIDYTNNTMDVRIAGVLGATTPYSAIYLGARANEQNQGVISPSNTFQDDPAVAYARLFNTAPPSNNDTTYLKVFDTNKRALDAIKTKLSQDERERLDAHGAALERIEQRITAQLDSGNVDPGSCAPGSNFAGGDILAIGKTQADIAVAALECGLTRVAVLQLGNHQALWTGHTTDWKPDHHQACHGGPTSANSEMVRYLSDVPAYFIKRLNERNLLTSTVFVQVTCMGNGQDHSSGNAPFIVSTRMPGFTQGFSTRSGGDCRDLIGAIPKGLGINGMLQGMGSNNLGLV